MSDHHREDEARWVEAMRQRHARGQEHVCGLADVLRTLEERDEARAEVERLRATLERIAQGFDSVNGAAARMVDSYYKGLAEAALGAGK